MHCACRPGTTCTHDASPLPADVPMVPYMDLVLHALAAQGSLTPSNSNSSDSSYSNGMVSGTRGGGGGAGFTSLPLTGKEAAQARWKAKQREEGLDDDASDSVSDDHGPADSGRSYSRVGGGFEEVDEDDAVAAAAEALLGSGGGTRGRGAKRAVVRYGWSLTAVTRGHDRPFT